MPRRVALPTCWEGTAVPRQRKMSTWAVVQMERCLPTNLLRGQQLIPSSMSTNFDLVCTESDERYLCLVLLDSLVGVADRIDGPYNVDTVIGTIHMRIAEAISNLQENKDSLTAKVRACAWAWLRVRCE